MFGVKHREQNQDAIKLFGEFMLQVKMKERAGK